MVSLKQRKTSFIKKLSSFLAGRKKLGKLNTFSSFFVTVVDRGLHRHVYNQQSSSFVHSVFLAEDFPVFKKRVYFLLMMMGGIRIQGKCLEVTQVIKIMTE